MGYSTLALELEGDLAVLTLNRPEKRNAISPEMVLELTAAFDEVESGRARVVILTGAGTAFCAGLDFAALKASTAQSPRQIAEDTQRIAQMFRRIYHCSKPIIAAVNGPAIAGGTGIATLADFTLAVPEATFGYTEVRIGFVPAIVSAFLVRQVGEKRARDLLLTGRIFHAEEARQLGLVNEVLPREKLLARARELAAELAALSPSSLANTKRLLASFAEPGLERELELSMQESARMRASADFREGVNAFLEKRKAVWRDK